MSKSDRDWEEVAQRFEELRGVDTAAFREMLAESPGRLKDVVYTLMAFMLAVPSPEEWGTQRRRLITMATQSMVAARDPHEPSIDERITFLYGLQVGVALATLRPDIVEEWWEFTEEEKRLPSFAQKPPFLGDFLCRAGFCTKSPLLADHPVGRLPN